MSVGVHLLEHLVDVDRVGLGALLLALAALTLGLGLLLLLGLLGGHAAETHPVRCRLLGYDSPFMFEGQHHIRRHQRYIIQEEEEEEESLFKADAAN